MPSISSRSGALLTAVVQSCHTLWIDCSLTLRRSMRNMKLVTVRQRVFLS